MPVRQLDGYAVMPRRMCASRQLHAPPAGRPTGHQAAAPSGIVRACALTVVFDPSPGTAASLPVASRPDKGHSPQGRQQATMVTALSNLLLRVCYSFEVEMIYS